MFEAKVMDCQKKRYTNRDSGEVREYYILGCFVDGVGIGFVYSETPYQPGDEVVLTLFTDRNHKFSVSLEAAGA